MKLSQMIAKTNLNETGVDQNTSAERVENSTDDAGGRAVRVVRCADP